ncbi:MAG: hypothetical protein J7L95_08680 [Prolixibacteraceae bacterium]|nr:hypothetical protein [Prolixibacteraceae bacterium]
MHQVIISEILLQLVPGMELSCIECDVKVRLRNEELWRIILEKIKIFSETLRVEEISRIPAILASRSAYKACGKDPARYRLSAEALLRRVVKRYELYQVNNVVDALNLVSFSTGFSIGGYDADKIDGSVVFGIGRQQEPYSGIGRGELNIESLPVFRDKTGAFGSPTSDSVRTSVTEGTKRFLMVIIGFGATTELPGATQMAKDLLEKYADASNIQIKMVKGEW